VITGLSRIPELNEDNVWSKVPIFSREGFICHGSDGDSDFGFNNTFRSSHTWFYEDSIAEHLNCEQLSMRKKFRIHVVKFQFSWYELVHLHKSEDRSRSGRLYRDDLQRSLQLQSFMVSNPKCEFDFRLTN
jgi:hypothetical protein